jgi:two-component system NtrC family sensor kinase
VFLNLINNAIDAMGRDGELRLGARAHDGGVEVVIADNGPGIPAADLQRIFEPFFSTKDASGRPHGGLGLAICQEIMRQLGGRIGVESKPGQGTTFTLWFPLEPDRT